MARKLPGINSALIVLTCILSINANAQTFSWAKQFGASNVSLQKGDIYTDDYGYLVTAIPFTGIVDFDPGPATLNLNAANGSKVLLKLDPSGTLISALQLSLVPEHTYVDGAGNVYMVGSFQNSIDADPGPGTYQLTSEGYYDIFIIKLNSSWQLQWAQRIGGPGSDQGNSILAANDGNVYFTGKFGSIGSTSLSPDVDFDPDPDGEFIMTSEGNSDVFLCSFNASGAFRWANSENVVVKSSDKSGNIYLLNIYDANGVVPSSMYVSKFDAQGTRVWSTLLSNNRLEIDGLDASDNGEVVVSGGFSGNIMVGSFNLISTTIQDPFFTKLDNTGTVILAKSFRCNGFVQKIVFDASDNIFLTGYFNGSGNIDFDPGPGVYNLNTKGNITSYVEMLNSFGEFQWIQKVGGESKSSTMGRSLALGLNGEIYTLFSFSGSVDFDPGASKAIFKSRGSRDLAIQKLMRVKTASKAIPDAITYVPLSLAIYPNPSKGRFTIVTPTVGEDAIIEVYDLHGRIVYNRKLKSNETFIPVHLERNVKGVFIITISGRLAKHQTKILIQ